ncbi:hypothetical protein [Kineococcus sp. SYSU DK006]|uniref:hypothetical protein n=1 Tax=Kineococcus sp. SYSU DK006 TaxID=3383127 RepID=UPI003D7E3727
MSDAVLDEGALGVDAGAPPASTTIEDLPSPSRTTDDLEDPAVVLVLAGTPPIRPRPAVVDSIGGDERSVQQHVLTSLRAYRRDDVGQVGGLGGDDVESPVQGAVARREADAGIHGEVSNCAPVAHEPQQENGLGEAPQRPPAPPRPDRRAVC